jgi:hypothetical protein
MGFGSYDESEQENQQQSTADEDVEAVNVHENDHQGEVSYENEADTDQLLSQLAEMKAAQEEEEDED